MFTFFEKLKYYKSRINDKSLSEGQRSYALSFVEGAEQGIYNGKNNKVTDTNSVETIKKQIALNKRYGTDSVYFQGMLSATEHYANKRKK